MSDKLTSELHKGAWNGATAYTIGDTITSAGSSYVCIANHTNQVPPNVTYWALLASIGATGATGATGSTGATGPQGPAGEMTGPGVSVDSEIALFDGITGEILKRASSSGIAKVTSGVLSALTGSSGITAIIDDDTMATAAATNIPTAESVKMYVDTEVAPISTGWIPAPATAVYVSASSMKFSGADYASLFPKSTRWRLKQGGGYKYYAQGEAATFSTDTTVPVAVTTDFTIANAAITDLEYSYDVSPIGYPNWFTWPITWVGYSASPTVSFSVFNLVGNICYFREHCSAAGTSGGANSTRNEILLPVKVLRSFATSIVGLGTDNGTLLSVMMGVFYNAGSTTLQLSASTSQNFTNWTGSGNKSANVEGWYEF